MNRFFVTAATVLLVGVVAAGFYRGWFTRSSRSPEEGSSKVNVNLTMDREKMQEDAQAITGRAAELTGKVTDQAEGAASGEATK